jgi:hypothetical protein
MSNRYYFTIKELEEKFEEAARRIGEIQNYQPDLMLMKPGPGRWSIHEICLHLVEFGKLYLREMDKAIAKANPMPQRDDPFRPRWHFRRMAAFFEPPYKLKLKTLPVLKPGNQEEVRETLGELADIQANVLYILEQAGASRWNLKKIKAKNPVFRFLSMSLIEFLVIMEVHQRRHFWQIEQNLKALEKEK